MYELISLELEVGRGGAEYGGIRPVIPYFPFVTVPGAPHSDRTTSHVAGHEGNPGQRHNTEVIL